MLVNETPKNLAGKKLKFNSFSVLSVFSETYPIYGDMGNEKLPQERNYAYKKQRLVVITSLLSLPNKKRNSDKFTFSDLFKNMIDRDSNDEAKGKFSTLDEVFAVPMFIYHVLRSLFRLPFNIAKIFTELLPGLGEEACRIAMEKNRKGNFLKFHAARFGYGVFSVLHFIGRALTSPVKGWIAASDKNDGLGALSLLTSGFGWGLILTFGLSIPLAPIAATSLIVAKLASNTFALGILSFLAIMASSVRSVFASDGIVKPFVRSFIKLFKPSKQSRDDKKLDLSYKEINKVIPIQDTGITLTLTPPDRPPSPALNFCEPIKVPKAKLEAVDFDAPRWLVRQRKGG